MRVEGGYDHTDVAAYAQSLHTPLRQRAAADPACPPHLLERLAGDREVAVRACVAANPSCPARLPAQMLLVDDAAAVRSAVLATIAQYQPAALTMLATIATDKVAIQLLKRPDLPADAIATLHDAGVASIDVVAAHPNTPAAVLVELWNAHRLTRVLTRPNLPTSVLDAVVTDPKASMKHLLAVATNPSATAAHLEDLALRGSAQVAKAVAAHPACTPTIRAYATMAGLSAAA